jgi:hypothetical protein
MILHALKGLLVFCACINNLIAVQRKPLCGNFLHPRTSRPPSLC